MMYLILVLIIPMVSWSHPEIGQLPPTPQKCEPLLFRHAPILVSVQQAHYLVDHVFLALGVEAIGALMLEPVRRVYLDKIPVSAVVEVV